MGQKRRYKVGRLSNLEEQDWSRRRTEQDEGLVKQSTSRPTICLQDRTFSLNRFESTENSTDDCGLQIALIARSSTLSMLN